MSAAPYQPPEGKKTLKLTPASNGTEDVGAQALSEALKSSFVLVKIVMACLVVYFCCSNFFTVKPNERAVVLRFGKPTGAGEAAVLGPGFHAAWPYPIDEVKKIPAEQVLSAGSTLGWHRVEKGPIAASQPAPPTLNPVIDGYVLTGDGSILHLQATLRYQITDTVQYYFGFTNAAALVTNALNNALFRVAAGFTVDDALRKNLAGLQERIAARVEELARDQNLGVTVQQVDLVAAPPRQVKEAFDEVNLAENELGTKINNAQADANGILARATGEAASRKNSAETDRSRMVADLEGEARYFTELLPSYQKDTALFTQRLQIEALGRIMTKAQDKFFLPARADGQPRELRLQLNREPQKLAAPVEEKKTDGHGH